MANLDMELQSIETALNILRTDIAAQKVIIDELFDDQGTNKTLLDSLKTQLNAVIVDLGVCRTQTVALVADMTNRINNFNTLTAKLNLDATVADADYATAVAKTAVDPAAMTATAVTESSAAGMTASKTALTAVAGT